MGADCFPACPGWSTPAPGGRDYAQTAADRTHHARVRATIAVERIARLMPTGKLAATSAPATTTELADALEVIHGHVAALTTRATAAEAERDAYREALEGGRAFLGLVVPELVYPRRIVGGMDADGVSLDDWKPGPFHLHALPPDPLTELQREVADLTAAVGTLVARTEPTHTPPSR